MKNTWVLSDFHFSHNQEFIYAKRGYKSWQEMDEALIQLWNDIIKPEDTVINCGDLCFQPATRIDYILPKLNGKKIITLGNHDTSKELFKYHSKVLAIYLTHSKTNGVEFVFSHIPLHPSQFEIRFVNAINIHGHIHEQKKDLSDKYFNVCYDVRHKIFNLDELRGVKDAK